MDEALIKALNDFTNGQGLRSLDDVLADPESHTYRPQVLVDEMGGLFEGGPDSVEWLRQQRGARRG